MPNAYLIHELTTAFSDCHERPPEVLFRSPGRVNLIGEHTDYSELPVLPVAIQRATYVAVAPEASDGLVARSLQLDGEARLGWDDPQAQATASWHRYLAGVMLQLRPLARGRGARLVIHGDLPFSGGLSSSSSLTMGLLGALNQAWGLGLSRRELVDQAIVAERHVGVESGGMDQTVIGLAQAGSALRIDFAPRGQQPVPLPRELRLVVAYSGTEAPKGGAIKRAYNERVVGCRLAAALLAARRGVEPGGEQPPLLGQVATLPGIEDDLQQLPHETSAARVADRSGYPVEQLVRLTAGDFGGGDVVLVRPVARHVLGEARRVGQAQQALLQGDLPGLGRLLNRSHQSLAGDFRCSTDGLDRLCEAMRGAGALGARLTGAGFGGHAIAATDENSLEPVLAAARQATGGPALEVRASAGLQQLDP